MEKLRIGIVGTGRIAQRFAAESREVPQVTITAIYNPRIESAVYFAETNGIDRKEVLLTDETDPFLDAVDAVYIAAPHEHHFRYAQEFLLAGKHVLCEKPMALSGQQAAELFALAQENGLVCMEAVKTAYCPGFLGLLMLLENGAVGQIYDVEACFTKIGTAAGRELWGRYGGSFLELGSYPLLPIVKILGTQSRESYLWSLDSAVGTDSYTKTVITYQNATATAKTGLGVKSEGELIVAGEKGYIRIPSPWWLTKRVEVHHEDARRVEVYEFPFEGSGLRYEIRAFADRIQDTDNRRTPVGLTPEESIWMAYQMELFLESREKLCEKADNGDQPTGEAPGIWAHRGCSMLYPENTLQAFQAAAEIPGIRGIELDVQLTRDGTIVVIHDERIDRTTIGKGFVRDYTLAELKQLYITPSGRAEAYRDPKTGETCTIPTLQEVFDLLAPYCRTNGLKINIELKNSIYRYEGMEKLVVDMVAAYGLEDSIVYSSFLHESVGLVRELCPGAQTGTLAGDIFSCIEGMQKYHADALHPCNNGMGINPETVTMLKENRIPVRIWNSEEPFFGQSRVLKNCDLKKYVRLGATDLITNVPERYLPKKDMMNRVWAAQIEVMEEIRRVCDKHGLRFFADWGSLLGAVRHRGFIPWDDDLDIGMLREDYQRFLEIAPEELQAPFELKSLYNDPTHDNVKCRVITGRSMNFEPEYLARFHDCPYVVGVDIFPIDYITRDPEKLAQQEETIRFLMTAAASVPEQPPYDEKVLELADKIEKTVGKPINRKNRLSHELKRLVDEVSALYTSEDADEVCSMIDLAMGWDYHAGKEWYAGSVEMPFENTTIPVPVGYDGILKIKYGADYMIPRGGGGSHDYPFYRKQADGLKAQIEQEMKITLTDEELDLLIEEKINSCKGATAGFLGDE